MIFQEVQDIIVNFPAADGASYNDSAFARNIARFTGRYDIYFMPVLSDGFGDCLRHLSGRAVSRWRR